MGAYRFEHLPPGGYIVGINLRDQSRACAGDALS